MKDEITYRGDGSAQSFTGAGAVAVYAMAVLASGLRLYAQTGMKPNRAYTPTAMMRAARAHLGDRAAAVGARDYVGMADLLSARVAEEKARIEAELDGGR